MRLGFIVPSRGRPHSVAEMAKAWEDTGAKATAGLIWAIDWDDPTIEEYKLALASYPWMYAAIAPKWMPMVPKLNRVALAFAPFYTALGFMGDDHRPRSTVRLPRPSAQLTEEEMFSQAPSWTNQLAAAFDQEPISILYGRDGFQDVKLPTWWVMSSQIIQELGKMVPARVDHMFCDNAVMKLGTMSGCLRYLPDVLIEHMHPVAGKAEMDDGYERVNRPEQYAYDQLQFMAWLDEQAERDAKIVLGLRRGV